MERLAPKPVRSKKRRYVAAMVLGTALSALGTASAATVAAPGSETRAVNDISRYCTTCWRNARLHPDCWSDCTQEVFSRLLERVTPAAWNQVLNAEGLERREFLRAIDAVKKRTQRSRKFASILSDSVADRRDGQEQERSAERDAVRGAAEELLTPRQSQVIELTFDGWSVHEIALELRTSPERVSDEKYKAIRRLRDRLATAEAANV